MLRRQHMVLLKTAQPGARALLDYLQSPAAREVFARYGFADVMPN
jgi:ABC-type molybdate transport system substrate-binding protein